jgi:tetratricopeptide (TPR) repeat protein
MNSRLPTIFLALTSFAFAQTTTPAGSEKTQPKPGQSTQAPTANTSATGAAEKSQNPNAARQSATPPNSGQNATTAPAAPPPPSKPAHRTPPAAKSQEEFNAFQQISAMPDSAAAEKAADDFAQKFPQSDLRPLLYGALMRRYQQANDSDKTLEMARKVLQYLPDDTMALVMSATVLAERTRESDLDRDERYAEAKKNAQKAIDTVDTGFMVPANITPEQYESAKHVLLSMAHSSLGMVALSEKNDAAAEQHFKETIQLNGSQTDPLIYMRLALAQDHQKKYAEALTSARTAVQNAPANSPLQGLAQQEVDRLVKLTGAPAPASSPSGNTPGSNSSSNVPKTNPK